MLPSTPHSSPSSLLSPPDNLPIAAQLFFHVLLTISTASSSINRRSNCFFTAITTSPEVCLPIFNFFCAARIHSSNFVTFLRIRIPFHLLHLLICARCQWKRPARLLFLREMSFLNPTTNRSALQSSTVLVCPPFSNSCSMEYLHLLHLC